MSAPPHKWLENRMFELLSRQQRDYENQGVDLTRNIATWLLIANAAMLSLLLGGVVQGNFANVTPLVPMAWAFAAGLGFAFVGALLLLVSVVLSARATASLLSLGNRWDFATREIEDAATSGAPLPPDAPAQVSAKKAHETGEEVRAYMRNLVGFTFASWALLSISAICTGAGALAPLVHPEILKEARAEQSAIQTTDATPPSTPHAATSPPPTLAPPTTAQGAAPSRVDIPSNECGRQKARNCN